MDDPTAIFALKFVVWQVAEPQGGWWDHHVLRAAFGSCAGILVPQGFLVNHVKHACELSKLMNKDGGLF